MRTVPEVSVIIPMFNGASSIGRQLDALAAQEASVAWEVVIADNGSTDDSREVVLARVPSYPVPLSVVDASQKQGIAYARNTAVKYSKGVKLLFCDCDDEVSTTWVQSGSDALTMNDAVSGPVRDIDDPSKVEWPARTSFGYLLRGANFGARRASYDHVGGLDESLPAYGGEDIDFSLRCSDAKFRIGIPEGMLVNFRPARTVGESLKKVYRSGHAEVAIWRKHENRFSGQLGFSTAIGRLFLVPIHVFKMKSVKSASRLAVVRYAHVVAQVPRRRAHKLNG